MDVHRIELTKKQRATIRQAIGRDVNALRLGALGSDLLSTSLDFPRQLWVGCDEIPGPDKHYTCPHPSQTKTSCGGCGPVSDFPPVIFDPDLGDFFPEALRDFRDYVLGGTDLGDYIIEEYYTHEAEFSEILNTHPELLEEAKGVFSKNVAQVCAVTLVKCLSQDATVPEVSLETLTPEENVKQLIGFLDHVGVHASQSLKNAIYGIKPRLAQFAGKTTREIIHIFEAERQERQR